MALRFGEASLISLGILKTIWTRLSAFGLMLKGINCGHLKSKSLLNHDRDVPVLNVRFATQTGL